MHRFVPGRKGGPATTISAEDSPSARREGGADGGRERLRFAPSPTGDDIPECGGSGGGSSWPRAGPEAPGLHRDDRGQWDTAL